LSYEKQTVGANQQALNSAAQQYRTNYQKQIGMLSGLFSTAKPSPLSGSQG
jgi:hypothetical protein